MLQGDGVLKHYSCIRRKNDRDHHKYGIARGRTSGGPQKPDPAPGGNQKSRKDQSGIRYSRG